ncbi:MAG: DUF366 family protein [Bdellovibrionales bacterium]|nr:DUF366 family protein [Bdellovibrionales bacterium]
MQSLWIAKNFSYDGTQLRSLFAYLSEGVLGNSIVAWQGSCDIKWENMLDGEDLLAQSPIVGMDMLHFIVEIFDCSLFGAVSFQRVITSLAKDLVKEKSQNVQLLQNLVRIGDDIFCGEQKLSISVATLGSRSALIHFALNVTNEGTPVKTASLKDLGIDSKDFAHELMQRVVNEFQTIREATYKVRSAP